MNGDFKETGECSATFVIRVNKKPNEPWRGNVVWVSERCESNFSTMQELFQLMDSSLQEASAETARSETANAASR